ncbi:MAG: hypothetical protein HY704_11725 [Gemmatimonadetes bacterium]|nr:hypothetical protein [Gemmatimonadota bacterium]
MEDDKPWDVRIFERIPSGVDTTLIEENLRLTATERLENMRRVLRFVQGVRATRGDRLPEAS